MEAAAPLLSVPDEPPTRDWSLLPLDVLASVFVRLSAVDVLKGAGLVCRSWLQAAKVPDVWRVVDMENHIKDVFNFYNSDLADLGAMVKVAIDRSDGQLRDFAGKYFVTDELMQYILERSSSLITLRLVSCWMVFSPQVANMMKNSPLKELRTLELDNVDITVGELTDFLENCPVLEVLTVHDCTGMYEKDEQVLRAKFGRIKTLTYYCVDVCIDGWLV